jgi:hypothetical protein
MNQTILDVIIYIFDIWQYFFFGKFLFGIFFMVYFLLYIFLLYLFFGIFFVVFALLYIFCCVFFLVYLCFIFFVVYFLLYTCCSICFCCIFLWRPWFFFFQNKMYIQCEQWITIAPMQLKSWREQACKKYTTQTIPQKIYHKRYTTKNIHQSQWLVLRKFGSDRFICAYACTIMQYATIALEHVEIV